MYLGKHVTHRAVDGAPLGRGHRGQSGVYEHAAGYMLHHVEWGSQKPDWFIKLIYKYKAYWMASLDLDYGVVVKAFTQQEMHSKI